MQARSKNIDPKSTKYLVISPVRDEAAYLQSTIDCMAAQSVRPTEWIIVNDGSTDQTAQIIDAAASRHSWIRAVHRTNRGFRKSGGGVVEAFNDGLSAAEARDWQFIVKMDGDLSFEPTYFETCFERFAAQPDLGIGGGVICYQENGVKRFEHCPRFHVRGATKIYRRGCWDAIGGYWPAPGWDTLDEVKANRLGWRTESFPELHLIHHRYTGAADGVWGGLKKNGIANYVCGYHPVFMIAKCARRLVRPPYVVGAAALFYGYLSGYLRGIPQVDDRETIGFLRRQQLSALWGRETIWR